MWLMYNVPGINKHQAYDQARKEFYLLRQAEEIERRVAKEEARMVGSYFGQSFLQVGMRLEDQQHERWKHWAEKQINNIRLEQAEDNAGFSEETEELEAADMDQDSVEPPVVAP